MLITASIPFLFRRENYIAYYERKDGDVMFLIILLALIAIILTIIILGVLSVTGAAGILIFGDVIICVALIVWLIKKLIKK